MMKAIATFFVLLCIAASAHAGGIYYADEQVPLEQAIQDALDANHKSSQFWVVVASSDNLAKITRDNVTDDMKSLIHSMQNKGGGLLACGYLLEHANLSSSALIPRVKLVWGWSEAQSGDQSSSDVKPSRSNSASFSRNTVVNRRLFSVCSEANAER